MKKLLIFLSVITTVIILTGCEEKIEEYTVYFNTDGASELSAITLEEGSTISIPEVIKENYTLEGWYTSADFGVTLDEKWDFTTSVVNNEITLYAKWVINQYDINYYFIHDTFSSIQLNFGETIINFALGGNHSSAVTSEGRIFTWGRNFEGQLGNGSTDDIFELDLSDAPDLPTEITENFNLSTGEKITDVSLGDYFTSAITSEGRIFTWGLNNCGQLGDGTVDGFYNGNNTPIDITAKFNLNVGEKITNVSLGGNHSSAVTSEGRIFTWGSNSSGQLGNARSTFDNIDSLPIEITDRFSLNIGETITKLELGLVHSSAITSDGRIFMWGSNQYGQLGDGSTSRKIIPTDSTNYFNLNIEEKIIDVSLGWAQSMAITSEGRIFTWGYNIEGQLGIGTIDLEIHASPIDISENFNLNTGETFTEVSLGSFHSSVITNEGRIFTWGLNNYGQLGDGTKVYNDVEPNPTEITANFSLNEGEIIIEVILGTDHSMATTSDGRVFGWGNNTLGQLGETIRRDIYAPVEITSSKAILYQSVTYDLFQVTEAYIPIKEGYTLDGWYCDDILKTVYPFTTMPASDFYLYGKWILND